MKKSLFIAVLAVLALGTAARAEVFPITATIPAATKVNFVVSAVTPGATPVFTDNGGLNLNFATAGGGMQFDTDNGIWTGSRFFAIDLAPSTAANIPAPGNYSSITFSYGSNVVPAGQPAAEGLNKRATITAVRVSGAAGSQTETPVITARAIGVGTIPSLTQADVTGGFLRVYVGLATGELQAGTQNPVAANSVPFTNGDTPGTYTGTLTITATLI